MFTLAYKELRSEGFVAALAKVESCPTYPSAKTSYDVGKMVKEIFDVLVLCQNEFVDLLKGYAVLDDKGAFVPIDGKPDSYQIIPEKIDQWRQALTHFQERTVAIHRHKLNMDNLSCVGLAPKEMLALESILLT